LAVSSARSIGTPERSIVDSVREKRATFTLRDRSPTIGILSTKRCHTGRPPAALDPPAEAPDRQRPAADHQEDVVAQRVGAPDEQPGVPRQGLALRLEHLGDLGDHRTISTAMMIAPTISMMIG
jgi:hypothetical protein